MTILKELKISVLEDFIRPVTTYLSKHKISQKLVADSLNNFFL